MGMDRQQLLLSMFDSMQAYFGTPEVAQYASSFEAVLAVVLGQGGKQKNALQRINESKKYTNGEVTPLALSALPQDTFAGLFAPSKKENVISRLLEYFISLADESELDSHLAFLQTYSDHQLRELFLSIRGIGLETADNILLHAFDRPVFVPSTSTYRILYRHGLIYDSIEYSELCEFFTDVLPKDTSLFKQYNILLASTARAFCKVGAPACQECPLKPFLESDPVE